MKNSRLKQPEENKKVEMEGSFRNAMYTSILFVGGGIAFFWLLLFITFSIRL